MRTTFAIAAVFSVATVGHGLTIRSDICVYGGTSGGVAAAVQSARMGKSVSLVVFNNHLGGMTSGGLGWTDVGNQGAIGGISLEFYTRVGQKYGSASPAYTFEPHVAEAVFGEMVADAGVPVYTNQRLDTVSMSGNRIVSLRMDDLTVYEADVFIDATYEGDLLAAAGVSYTVGREGVGRYDESLNGVVNPPRPTHNFGVVVDPYVVPGDAGSGLLPYIQAGGVDPGGTADHRVQSYNFRLCLTTVVSNQIPITAPTGYDPGDYALLGRYIAASGTVALGDLLKINSMPNGKTDINNRGAFSTDFIGQNWEYPEADYVTRGQIWQAHEDYTRGLLYFLGNDASVPVDVRSAMQRYGLCKDEFQDSGGWPHQLYVREARRMVSDYVVTENNCRGLILPYDGVGLAAYTMDSHNCRRYVNAAGAVKNEGDVQQGIPGPYPVPYRSLVPRRSECGNLLVPWSLSASHIAFGSIRMEPVLMVLGQSTATAAAQAIDAGVSVQDVNVSNLQARLVLDGQVVAWGAPANRRPRVEMAAPLMDATFAAGTSIVVEAEAWDEDGSVERVEFYAGGWKIGEATAVPYRVEWTSPSSARFAVWARAIDDGGAENLSGVVSVRVGTTNDPGRAEDGIIVDNADAEGVARVGDWISSTSVSGYYGSDYLHDGNTGQGLKSVRFTPTLPATGTYNTFVRFSMNPNRATAVPVDVFHAGGTTTLHFDQQAEYLNGRWIFAGVYGYLAGTTGSVLVRNDGADGYVTADAVSFSLVGTNAVSGHETSFIQEYFNGYGSNGFSVLTGLAGGEGWLSPWVADVPAVAGYEAGRQTAYDVPDYSDDKNLAGPEDGRMLMQPGDDPGSIVRRSFATPLDGTIWISALVRHEDDASGEVRLWLETVTPGSGADTAVGLVSGDQLTMRYGGADVLGGELESSKQDLLFLVKVVVDAVGGADAVSFWVKTEQEDVRSEAVLGAPALSISSGDILGTNLTYIGFSGGDGMNANVDAIRISNRSASFKDVVQPTTWPVLYETGFPESVGAVPAGWGFLVGDIGDPGWRVDDGGDLRYDAPGENGLARYVGGADGDDLSAISNCLIEVTFRKGGAAFSGLAGRLRDDGSYYHARLHFATQFEVYRFLDGVASRIGQVATSDSYDSGEAWRLRFLLKGETLVGDVFNQADTLAGRLVVTDATFVRGHVGLRCQNPTAYEAFQVSAPPVAEPRGGLLLLVR